MQETDGPPEHPQVAQDEAGDPMHLGIVVDHQ
jgi:hypothetical protein